MYRAAIARLPLVAAALALLAGTPAGADELTGTLKKVKDTRAITIGYREASFPFSYLDSRKRPLGYSIALCLAIVDDVKEELGIENLQVRYVPVTSQTRMAAVVNGEIDLECGSTTNNLTRQKEVAFSPVIFVTGTKLLVKRSARVKSYRDLKGRTIAVTEGTTNQQAMKAISDKEGLGFQFVAARDHDESFRLVEAGKADAFAMDDVLLYGLIARARKGGEFLVAGEFLSYDPYGIMFRRNDPQFAAVVKGAFERLGASREIEQIYDTWFVRRLPTGETLGLTMSPQLRSIFEIIGLPQ